MWPFKRKYTRLHIYMKSGNVINLDNIVNWETKSDDKIRYLHITARRPKHALIVSTIVLDQIEAITQS